MNSIVLWFLLQYLNDMKLYEWCFGCIRFIGLGLRMTKCWGHLGHLVFIFDSLLADLGGLAPWNDVKEPSINEQRMVSQKVT